MIKNHNCLEWAHPLVRDWFLENIGDPTEPQISGWPHIVAGKTTLISAPTGSGKTLAAFLACIDKLVRRGLTSELINETAVLYVSPLKALSNDIQKNLTKPLIEIAQLAKARGIDMPDIQVAVRTGDTLARERQAMLRKPPHILVTTPESLYLLLTADKSRSMLSTVKTVIVDEIHALVDNKRGAHLALSLERLENLTSKPPIRIGLSATQNPIETVAAFLSGSGRKQSTIVNIGHKREMDLQIEVPSSELGPITANETWDEIYDRIAQLVEENRSTLVFVNTRRLAERLAHQLAQRLGPAFVSAHHGSLSRKLRLQAESKLKNGELKVLVATASLELGIDIGNIDLVCQLGSPRSTSITLQRIGRSGHWQGAIPKGRIFVTTRDELLECAALVNAIKEGELDELIIPEQPIDILAQQIVATCATGDWHENDLFDLVRKAYPYRLLARSLFDRLLVMLSEGIAASRGRYGAYLFRDQVQGIVKARRGSRLIAIMNGGAIPDNALFTVIAEPNGVMVGSLDEDFAVESSRGDIILLGNTAWLIRRVEASAGRVIVEDAHGAPPSVPFWRGEAPGRTNVLSCHVGELREKISQLFSAKNFSVNNPMTPDSEPGLTWLKDQCGLSQAGAEQLVAYVLQGRAVLGAVPSQQTIIAERFFDEGGGMQLVIHAPFGARINKAWGLALRKKFCRSFNFELQAAATDDGLNIALAEQHSFPLADVFKFLHVNTLKQVLTQAVLQSPLFTTRWRWVASRSLALIRVRNGRKVPPNIMRMLSDDLLAAVFPDAAACQDNLAGRDIELPDHPLTNEAMKEALNDALDIEGLLSLIQSINSGRIKCLAVDAAAPSVFAHEILNANPYAYLDDAPLEERRARAVSMRRVLPETVLNDIGKLDPAAILVVQQQTWPDVRNADELHDVLQTLIALPQDYQPVIKDAVLNWQLYFNELLAAKRANIAMVKERSFWVAAEKAKCFTAIYPQAHFIHEWMPIEKQAPKREEAMLNLIRGWMLHLGPISTDKLARILSINTAEIDRLMLQLEATGLILRGHFNLNAGSNTEWCERRLLARIHRCTLGTLRKQIEPVTAAQFMRWLLKWQHLAPGTQLSGEQGLLTIIKQLQGFELPANAWERKVFAKRLSCYDSGLLDRLCLSGMVGWGRLTPHPHLHAMVDEQINRKRIVPNSIAPITFFLREQSAWMPERKHFENELKNSNLSEVAKAIYAYLQLHGASFYADIVLSISFLKSNIEEGLWELVAAGAITADGFDNLRALIDPKRRLRNSIRKFSYGAGRWSCLKTQPVTDKSIYLEATCWQLLHRYGVVFRDLLGREKINATWRDLLVTFRRLEDRGEIRGGRFVSGFLGEQFALPYAVQSLRASRDEQPKGEVIKLAAVDPLNLVGLILPGERISKHSRQFISLQDGVPTGEK